MSAPNTNNNPAVGASRGGGTARGRGNNRGRGGQATRGGQGPPIAAQLRQLERLQEPEEMALFRRLRDLQPMQVRSVYGPSGLLDREVQLPASTMIRAGKPAEAPVWVSVLVAETLLNGLKAVEERERALARRETRLPEARRRASWGSLTPEERKILFLSQKEYNSFRAQSGTQASSSRQEKKPGK